MTMQMACRGRLELMREIYNADQSPASPDQRTQASTEQVFDCFSICNTHFNFYNLIPSRLVEISTWKGVHVYKSLHIITFGMWLKTR